MTRTEVVKQVQRIALYLFFFSINFEVWDPFNTDGFFSVSKLTGIIYALTLIPEIRYFNKADTKNPFLLSIWGFFAILTLVGLFNINTISYDFFDFTIFQNIFLFWFLLIHERKEHFVLEKGMLSFALGSVAIALLFYASVGIEYVDDRVRIFGDNSNGIGLRMCISMAILILATVQNRLNFGKARYLLLLPIPIMLQLMVETGSRVAFISFILILVAGVVLFKTKKHFGKILLIAMGAITSIILWIYLMQSEILTQRLLRSAAESDLAGRDVIWQGLLPLIEKNLIFGVGRTGYAYFTQLNFGVVVSPHNVILEVVCYTGIIGFAMYIYFMYRILKIGYHKYKTVGLLLPVLLLIPVIGILVSGQILNVKIGWVIFAYIVGGAVFKQNQRLCVAGLHENNTASQDLAFHR